MTYKIEPIPETRIALLEVTTSKTLVIEKAVGGGYWKKIIEAKNIEDARILMEGLRFKQTDAPTAPDNIIVVMTDRIVHLASRLPGAEATYSIRGTCQSKFMASRLKDIMDNN